MRDLVVLFLHLLTTVARLVGPGGARSVVAESILVTHQLLILNRSRRRAPNLHLADRLVAGVCTLFINPSRLIRAAIVLKPSTLFRLHRALTQWKCRRLFSSTVRKKPGPKGPSQEVIAAVVEMKTAESDVGVSANRATDRLGLRHFPEQGCGATHSRGAVPTDTGRGGAVVAHGPWAREGQSVVP